MRAIADISLLTWVGSLKAEGLLAQALGDQPSSLLGEGQDVAPAYGSQHCLLGHARCGGL